MSFSKLELVNSFVNMTIGLIAAGVGLGLVVLANVLTDTDLEYYFKHFLLSDRLAFAMQANELPHSYAARLFENRKQLLGDDPEEDNVKRLMNPYDAQVQLFDLLVCTSMKFIPEKSQTTYFKSGVSGMSMIPYTSSIVEYYSFRIEMQFMQFLEIDSPSKKTHNLCHYQLVDVDNFIESSTVFLWLFHLICRYSMY